MDKRKFAGRLSFGILLIAMGVTFFLNTAGVVDWGVWAELWRFWPVLLIVAGINVIFEKSPAWPVAYISPLLVIAVFWFVVTGYKHVQEGGASPFFSSLTKKPEVSEKVFKVQGYLPDEIERVDFTYNGGAGNFDLTAFEDAGEDEIARIEARTFGLTPEIEERQSNGILKLELSERSVDKFAGAKTNKYAVKLSPAYLYSMEFNCGAAEAKLDFSKLKIKTAEINCGAATVDVVVPEAGDIRSSLEVNTGASSVSIGVPKGVKVRIEQNGLGSVKADGVELAGKGVYLNKDWHGWSNFEVGVEINSAVCDIKIYAYEAGILGENSAESGDTESAGEDAVESAKVLAYPLVA